MNWKYTVFVKHKLLQPVPLLLNLIHKFQFPENKPHIETKDINFIREVILVLGLLISHEIRLIFSKIDIHDAGAQDRKCNQVCNTLA